MTEEGRRDEGHGREEGGRNRKKGGQTRTGSKTSSAREESHSDLREVTEWNGANELQPGDQLKVMKRARKKKVCEPIVVGFQTKY